MSLFKVVGNYYEDILDYFSREYKKIDPTFDPFQMEKDYLKYQDNIEASPRLKTFKDRFNGIFDIPRDKVAKKTQLIKLLATSYVKLYLLQEANKSYWESRIKTFTAMVIILIIMMVIIAVVFVFMMISWSLPNANTPFEKLQVIMKYLLIYTIVFTVLLLFVLNLVENIKSSNDRNNAHNQQFSNFSLQLVPNMQFQFFFVALGALSMNKMEIYDIMSNELKKQGSASGKSNDNANCPTTASTKIANYVLNKDPCKNKTNFDEIYDDLKDTIREYIFQFYNYGHGYTALRKSVVKSNSSFMLRDVRRIMSYYYQMLNKKGVYDDEVNNIKQARKLLDEHLIDKLDDLKINYFLERDVDDSMSLEALMKENEDPTKNPSFVAELAKLEQAISYLAMFLYALYKHESPLSTEFQARAISTYSPLNINAEETNDTFLKDTYKFFIDKMNSRFDDMLKLAKLSKPEDFNIIIGDFIIEMSDYMVKNYNNLIVKIKGTVLFPLEELYTKEKLNKLMRLTPFVYFENDFNHVFQEAYIKMLLPKVKSDIYNVISGSDTSLNVDNIINFKIGLVVNNLAEDLSNHSVSVKEHIDYVIDKLMMHKNQTNDVKLLDIYVRILERLDASIELKKQIKRSIDKMRPKFISSVEFVNKIDDMLFQDLFDGLDSYYMYEVLDDFYMEVSGAIGNSDATTPSIRTEHNIFYKQQKNSTLRS